MINERVIADKFGAIWKQHFPLLTPNFMKVFNETQVKSINKTEIPINDNVRYDLVSEVAFNLAQQVFDNQTTSREYLSNSKNLLGLVEQTLGEIWKFGSKSEETIVLNQYEVDEINKICHNIIEFIELTRGRSLEFKPKLRGYSFIPDLEADLSIDDTLYEVKTVNRNFKSSDLKQLFIYLALEQASKNMKWEYAGLYNPRKGTTCRFNVKRLVYDLSGGKSSNEAFEDLLNNLVRDVQMDSRF